MPRSSPPTTSGKRDRAPRASRRGPEARLASGQTRAGALGLADWFRTTRGPLHSLLALAPLVLLHSFLTWLFRPPIVAAAASWVQAPFNRLGFDAAQTAFALAAGFTVAAVALSARDIRRRRVQLRPLLIPAIWLEGAAWGLILHVAWNGLGRGSAAPSPGIGAGDSLALALGAGIYEELVFRVGVYGLCYHLIGALAPVPGTPGETGPARAVARTVLAVLATSFLFALAHHLGGEPITLGALAFRTAAALYLTSVFALRGFGVAACAHVAYDVLVGNPLSPFAW